jgi:mono/diheme cytochrome c family protein
MDDTMSLPAQDASSAPAGKRPAAATEARAVAAVPWGAGTIASWRALLLSTMVLAGVACTKPGTAAPAERGERVYLANCITCHNRDPARPGSAGPEIAGASRELLEAKVLRGEYPEGYVPKRSTHAMVPLPHLAARVDDLAAFLTATTR